MSYADGTGGWSGTDTSRERAERERDEGIFSLRLREVYVLLRRRGFHGATSSEVEDALRIHHGQASSALTNMHKDGKISRTSTRRDGSKVYKHPDYLVPSDTTEAYVRRDSKAVARVAVLEDRIERAFLAIMDDGDSGKAMQILAEQ